MNNMEEWKNIPLNVEDIFAGGSLLVIAIFSITIYGILLKIMKRQDTEIVGYRFLISAGISDILLLLNYSFWPALTILFKSEIIPRGWREYQQIYLDFAWFSMVFHYTVVSWSRWMAIRNPLKFRNLKRSNSYSLCSVCYISSFLLVISTHFQPWYVTFYYEPSSYGMLAEDFELYLSGGQSALFLLIHIAAIIPPIVFYTWSIILLYKRKKSKRIVHHHFQSNIESRLLLPCLINLATFIIGQILITVGTGEGKWAGYTVMLLFAANSALNPFLLLICSKTLRFQLLYFLRIQRIPTIEKKPEESMVFRNLNTVDPEYCNKKKHRGEKSEIFVQHPDLKHESATLV